MENSFIFSIEIELIKLIPIKTINMIHNKRIFFFLDLDSERDLLDAFTNSNQDENNKN
jgi:hypothetical protein